MNSSTIRIMRGLQMVTQHTVTLLERDGMIRAQKLVNHAVDMSQTASKVIVCNNNHTVNVDDEMPNKMKEAGQVVNGSNSNANTDYCAEKTTTAVDNARSANANANPCDTAAETETKTKTKTTFTTAKKKSILSSCFLTTQRCPYCK
uniref:Uncharacterized protein n=1 Tax=Leptocylindrus danicus TaxID=163516 RepID=A0A7S2K7A9_9STRA|mmetsp:Transcript_19108/g.28458  ORF Transcript_19108/g.28458 Transcript_19108/m.28458 type:complete len:147 (+) Transcript_19108:72-512(+)